jgi:signal transduction histidine kinase
MGEAMNFMFQFVQAGLDAGALAVCCEAIFQKRSEVKAKDLLLFPVLLVLCIVPRMNFTANERVIATLLTHGSEIVPANSIAGLLFLLFSVLLLNSIFFRWRDNGDVLSGTMAVFSLYLFVRCLCVAVLAVCGASEAWLIPGSRVLTLALVLLLLCTPFYGQIQQLLQTGGVTVGIVSSDIAILLMAALSVLSFHVDRFVSYLWLISVLLLALLLLDSILLFLHRRRMQERKRIHMIEQYVPIVEELISQVRARQHEFQNRMLAIDAAVASADTLEEAKREVAALTDGIAINPNDRELLSCDSKIIAGMLFGKIKQAEAVGIHIELQLHGLFKKTAAPETEWIEVIGILLDNAIEASPKGSTIFIAGRKNGAYLELLVSNPAPAMTNTEFMALFRKGFTTKSSQEGRGYGLYNILCITERYHGKILTRNERISEENYVVFGVLLP